MPNALTVADKLLLAAAALEEEGKRPFTAEDLVVAAWRLFPTTFGLTGYLSKKGTPAYPDSNRVFAEVMGSKPLRKRGLLQKVGRKQYRVTDNGREHAGLLKNRPAGTSGRTKTSLGRDTVQALQKLLRSRAFNKYLQSQQDKITFYDACGYWGISPHSSAIDLSGKVANVEGLLESALRSLDEAGPASFQHGGADFSTSDVGALTELHEWLQERFQQELDVIRERTDER